MSSGYLDILDELLATGLDGFSDAFLQRQAAYVLARQHPDGGFPGREGASDPYYTDFALRVLALAKYQGPAWARAAEYITSFAPEPRDIVTLFGYLNAARLLQQAGHPIRMEYDGAAIVSRQQVASGGLTHPGRDQISSYQTFLGALCLDLLDSPFPAAADAASAMTGLQCPDGGFSELPHEAVGQTNATAAATAFLRMHHALDLPVSDAAIKFLCRMQGADGGLRAHADAGESDLLSTFTGLLTLAGLDAADRLDLPAIARSVRNLAIPDGGFRACISDVEADIEYTYYGLATLAVLRAHLTASA